LRAQRISNALLTEANMRARTLRNLFVPIAVATLANACGGGGGGDSPPPAPPPPAPAPSPSVPPLATTAVDISAGQQIGRTNWADGHTSTGGTGQTLDNVPCKAMVETFHIHSHLAISLNGELLAIPNFIGQVPATASAPGCFYEVHVHDASGKLHVESDVPRSYNLGAFFKIWGQPLSTSNVAGITGQPIEFFVTDNGVPVRYTGDPNAIELTSKRLITIQIGTPLSALPNITWTGN
jgi:hypothetical protein